MENITILLSAFWGILLICSVAILSLAPSLKYALISGYRDNKIRYSGAFLSLCIGISSIYFHNIWTLDMQGVITLFGWIALIKGIVIALVPSAVKVSEKIIESHAFGFYLLFLFALGIYMFQWSLRTPLTV